VGCVGRVFVIRRTTSSGRDGCIGDATGGSHGVCESVGC
jgi:hypothetical protein